MYLWLRGHLGNIDGVGKEQKQLKRLVNDPQAEQEVQEIHV